MEKWNSTKHSSLKETRDYKKATSVCLTVSFSSILSFPCHMSHMSHSYVTCLIPMSHVSCLIPMLRVSFPCRMSHSYVTCLIRMSHVSFPCLDSRLVPYIALFFPCIVLSQFSWFHSHAFFFSFLCVDYHASTSISNEYYTN